MSEKGGVEQAVEAYRSAEKAVHIGINEIEDTNKLASSIVDGLQRFKRQYGYGWHSLYETVSEKLGSILSPEQINSLR